MAVIYFEMHGKIIWSNGQMEGWIDLYRCEETRIVIY
jgi:hypothetical protein